MSFARGGLYAARLQWPRKTRFSEAHPGVPTSRRLVACLGDAFVDVQVAGVRALPSWGEDAECQGVSLLPGGSCANAARHLASIGQEELCVSFFTCVGDDEFGRKLPLGAIGRWQAAAVQIPPCAVASCGLPAAEASRGAPLGEACRSHAGSAAYLLAGGSSPSSRTRACWRRRARASSCAPACLSRPASCSLVRRTAQWSRATRATG